MLLEQLSVEILGEIGKHVADDMEVAGLRGPSVIVRDIANLALAGRLLFPLVTQAWTALCQQLPAMLWQLDICDTLRANNSTALFQYAPHLGAVNLLNSSTRMPTKHSSGLQGLSVIEKVFLRAALRSKVGPNSPRKPLSAGLESVRAPSLILLTVTIEKLQYWWPTPSPTWSDLALGGARQLESVDVVRELTVSRLDRGLAYDPELSSLLAANEHHPYTGIGAYTWWGIRKLINDNWTPADLFAKQTARRMRANVCLHCMRPAQKNCARYVCSGCCHRHAYPCSIHSSEKMPPRRKTPTRRRKSQS